jgi:hypothetical protein
MIIFMCRRTARAVAHVRVTHHDYRAHPARSWLLWEGEVRIRHGRTAQQAAAELAQAVVDALDVTEDLPVGEHVVGQLQLPYPGL